MDCRHFDGKICINNNSSNYCNECKEYECNEREPFYDRADEVLHRYLYLEKRQLDKINFSNEYNFDDNTKKHLNILYSAKVELLEEIIKELYE